MENATTQNDMAVPSVEAAMNELARMGFDPAALQEAMLTLAANEMPAIDRANVLPALHSYMSPDLLATAEGQVVLIHEKPLPAPIWWAEYDPEYKQLIFVTLTGQIMGLGVEIPPAIDPYLRLGRDIAIIEIDDKGAVMNLQERKIVVRKNGLD